MNSGVFQCLVKKLHAPARVTTGEFRDREAWEATGGRREKKKGRDAERRFNAINKEGHGCVGTILVHWGVDRADSRLPRDPTVKLRESVPEPR